MTFTATGGPDPDGVAGLPALAGEVRRCVIRVPATAANLGPGLDTLGAAIDLWNEVHWERVAAGLQGEGVEVAVRGEGAADILSGRAENLVLTALRASLDELAAPLPNGRLTLVNRIPLARGLGSSAAAVVAGVALGRVLAGRQLVPEEIVPLAARIEGHADNVAPAALGGVQIVSGGGAAGYQVECPRLYGVVIWPEYALATADARRVLPRSVQLETTVRAIQRVALLVAALRAGDERALREATGDELHQDRRAGLVPGLADVLDFARRTMQLAAVISGSGPSLLVLSTSPLPDSVGRTLAERWRGHGIAARWRAVRLGGPGVSLSRSGGRRTAV